MENERLQDLSSCVQVSRRLAPTPTGTPEKPKRLWLEELEQRLAPDGPFDVGLGIGRTAGWGC